MRIAHGDSNKKIAVALGISEFTVRDHVSSLMRKTATTSRSALAIKLTASLLVGVELML